MTPKKQWSPARRIEERYRRELNALLNEYFILPDAATLGEIMEVLVKFRQAAPFLESFGLKAAARMVTGIYRENARSWREAARKGMRNREIYEVLQKDLTGAVGISMRETIRRNAAWIGSIPEDLREHATRKIAEMQQKGIRPEAIAKALRSELPTLTKSRAALIARTESSKASTALTRARSGEIGLDWYIWETSEDARVRPSHRIMDKVIINWHNAPSPELLDRMKSQGHYHAGDIYNCRCAAVPLVTFDQIRWPAKVYVGNQIRRLTLNSFKQLNGSQRLIAA